MESVLGKLEERIEEFVKAHTAALAQVIELETRVQELEAQAAETSVADGRIQELEEQRDAMAERLEKVLEHIDRTLSKVADPD